MYVSRLNRRRPRCPLLPLVVGSPNNASPAHALQAFAQIASHLRLCANVVVHRSLRSRMYDNGARIPPLLSSSLAPLATSDNSGYPTCPSDDCVVLRARRIIRAPLAEIFLFFYGLRPACFKKFSNFFFQGGVPPHSRAGQ